MIGDATLGFRKGTRVEYRDLDGYVQFGRVISSTTNGVFVDFDKGPSRVVDARMLIPTEGCCAIDE